MINGLAVPAVQQPTFGVAQRNQQVRPPEFDFASALPPDPAGINHATRRSTHLAADKSPARDIDEGLHDDCGCLPT